MAVDVRLPVLGDFMLEGTLVEWLAADGARVEKGDAIYRLETDKVSLDVEAPASGVLRQVAAAGATVPVNGLLGQIAEEGAAAPASFSHTGGEPSGGAGGVPLPAGPRSLPGGAPGVPPDSHSSPSPPSMGGATRNTASVAGGPTDDVRASPAARRLARELGVDLAAVAAANRGMRLREEHVQAFAARTPAAVDTAPQGPPSLGGERLSGAPGTAPGTDGPAPGTIGAEVRASPAARRLARELGVDLVAVARANPGARLREQHVQAFTTQRLLITPAGVDLSGAGAGTSLPIQPAAKPASGSPQDWGAAPHTPSAAGRADRAGAPLAGRRRVIAQRMHQSLQQMAQLTVSQQVDVTECVRLREQLVRLWAADGVRPTYTDFVVRAAALALREHPALNATLEDDAIITHDAIDVGLAVDAPEGLIVPVLRGADRLSLRDLAQRAAQAAEQARANRLGPDDLQGGTFTVTTLGALGIDFFTPIVNPPQVAIIGIGRVFPQLALVGGQLEQRQAMYLNLSFDHRAVDGAPAARFLNRVKELLELPVGLL